jgi:hypothetical protein
MRGVATKDAGDLPDMPSGNFVRTLRTAPFQLKAQAKLVFRRKPFGAAMSE